MEPVDLQKTPIVHEVKVESPGKLGLPYDTRPFESFIKPDNESVLHGGITIANQTNRTLQARVIFELATGYRLYIEDACSTLSTDQSVDMHTSYFVAMNRKGQFVIKLCNNN
ncbi:MAG: hypothetical protein KAR79_04465 [Simkaniaceae bacterium]|nr:hypothetical protein [Simkaniaceae bacterium]